jgi:hypothetical protein
LRAAFGSSVSITIVTSISVLLCSLAAEFLDLREDLAEEDPDAGEAGDVYRNTGFAEVPVGIDVLR